jgi:hypothetical protein
MIKSPGNLKLPLLTFDHPMAHLLDHPIAI